MMLGPTTLGPTTPTRRARREDRGGDDPDVWVSRAFECRDAIDHDCDGEAEPPGACATAVGPRAAATGGAEGAFHGLGAFGMVGDLTGVGLDDFRWSDGCSNPYTVSPGRSASEGGPRVIPEEAFLLVDADRTG